MPQQADWLDVKVQGPLSSGVCIKAEILAATFHLLCKYDACLSWFVFFHLNLAVHVLELRIRYCLNLLNYLCVLTSDKCISLPPPPPIKVKIAHNVIQLKE